MKRSISLVLCLVMLFSIFSVCGVVAGAADANDAMYIKSNGFVNDRITYTVYLKKNVSLAGAVVWFGYDNTVLEPVSGGAVGTTDAYGDFIQAVPGSFENGPVSSPAKWQDKTYSIGYFNLDNYSTGSSDKAFMTATFKVIDSARPKTSVKFYCVEFNSSNENLHIQNDRENPQLFYTHTTSTLNKTKHTSVYSIDGGSRITWQPTAGATGYKVYKVENGKSILLDGNVPANQNYFDDKTATPNAVTRYSVRSFNADGLDSAYAGTISGVYVPSPERMTATIQAKGVKLNWTAVSGATQYRIFRRVINEDGTRTAWTGLNTVASNVTSYVDTTALVSGTHYEYTVRVFTSLGSSAVCRYANLYFYAAPTVNVASVTGGAKVTWNKVAGATSYKVYRKYYGAKSYSLIAVIDGADVISDVSTLSYIDSAAISNKGVSYTVRAFGDNGSSAYVGKYFNYVQTPKLLGISNSAKGAYFRWSAVGGATSYRVYRKGLNDKKWTPIKTVTTTYYTDTTAKPGYHYYYTIIAVNKNNVYSGYDTVGLYTKFITTPKLTKITNESKGITVNWNSVYGVGYYEVYRKVGNAKTWTYVTTVKGTSFTDTNVKKGVTYTYTVRAKFNNIFSGYDTTGLKIKR